MHRTYTIRTAALFAALLFALTGLAGCAGSGADQPVEIPQGPDAAVTAHATEPVLTEAAETAAPSAGPDAPASPAPSEEAPGGIPPIHSVSDKTFTYDGTNVMRVDDRAYEICYFLEPEAKSYAGIVTEASEALEGYTDVYSLIIPTAYGVMMPDDMREKISYYFDMGERIDSVYGCMGSGVKTVSTYDLLMHHRDEFLYFRTDHHWTARGAWYAYAAFCRAKGIEPNPIDSYESVDFPGFLGTLYRDSGSDPALMPEETVTAYYPLSQGVEMVIHNADGSTYKEPVVKDVSSYSAIAKYGTFAGSDNPLTVFTNPNVTDGSVLIVIKESFGNAMMAFLSDHYSKIYEIDYRYWKGSVTELAKEVGATDLLFANNFMVISSKSNIGKISMILK